ncbi:MAG: cell division protein FtsX, partial [Myxococcota bacterium]
MRVFAALRYFAREAVVGLLRSWRVSVLAILTIAVSLFLAGLLLLVSQNLSQAIHEWRQEARFVVYLEPRASAAEKQAITERLRTAPWVRAIVPVSAEEGARRFSRSFPSLSELVADARYGALPETVEAELRPPRPEEELALGAWGREIARLP